MEDKSFELLTKMYSEIVEVKAGMNKLDIKVSNLDNKVGGLDNKVSNLDNKVSGLDNKVSGLDNKVSGLDNKVNNLDNRLIKLEVKIENDIERKLDLSLEGYKHLYEATSEIKEDIKDIKDTLCKHELSIFALNQK